MLGGVPLGVGGVARSLAEAAPSGDVAASISTRGASAASSLKALSPTLEEISLLGAAGDFVATLVATDRGGDPGLPGAEAGEGPPAEKVECCMERILDSGATPPSCEIGDAEE